MACDRHAGPCVSLTSHQHCDPPVCVLRWLWPAMSGDLLLSLPSTLDSLSASPSAIPMWSITSSVIFLQSWLLPALDIYVNEMVLFILAAFNVFFCPDGNCELLSVYIICHPENALSLRGGKAFSTCSSHPHCCHHLLWNCDLHVLQPSSSHSMDTRPDGICVLYNNHPHVNLSSSLRNKEVSNAFRRAIEKMKLLFST